MKFSNKSWHFKWYKKVSTYIQGDYEHPKNLVYYILGLLFLTIIATIVVTFNVFLCAFIFVAYALLDILFETFESRQYKRSLKETFAEAYATCFGKHPVYTRADGVGLACMIYLVLLVINAIIGLILYKVFGIHFLWALIFYPLFVVSVLTIEWVSNFNGLSIKWDQEDNKPEGE